jgi:hypothetical protein
MGEKDVAYHVPAIFQRTVNFGEDEPAGADIKFSFITVNACSAE